MNRTKSILSFVTAAALFAAAGQAQVVMSQVYGGGGGSGTYKEDFVVLFNKGTTTQTLTDAALVYSSATGNSWGNRVRLPSPLVIPAGQSYLVVTDSSGTSASITTLQIGGSPLVPDFVATGGAGGSGTIAIQLASAKIALISNFDFSGTTTPATNMVVNTAPTPVVGTVVDWLGWGTANNAEGGSPAAITTNAQALFRNGTGCDDTNVNSADWTVFAVNSAVPRTTQSGIQVCGALVPDIALNIGGAACGSATVGSSLTFVATATNIGTDAATGSTVTFTLSGNLGTIAATGAVVSGNTVTWTLPPLATGGGSATLNITATAIAGGTVLVNGVASAAVNETSQNNNSFAARNFVPFTGPAYSTAVTPLFVVVPSAYENANGGWNAGALGEFNDGLGTVRARNIPGRPVASADGSKLAFWVENNNGDSGTALARDFDGSLLVGQISGGALTTTLIASEGITAVDPANPTRTLRSGVSFPAALTAPVINNNGDFAFATQTIAAGDTNPTSVVVKGNVNNPSAFTVVARQSDLAAGVGTEIKWGPATAGANTSVFNATTIQSDGTVSFTGTISGTRVTASNDFVGVASDGTALAVRKGVTVPTDLQGTNAGAPITSIDASTAGVLSYSVDASGNNRLVTGQARLTATDTTDDGFVAVNGATVLQEGFPIVGSDLVNNVATFDSAFMQPDGSWYAVGNFAPLPTATVGAGFVVRNGVLLAKGGDPIVPGSSEVWSGSVNSRTFQGFASNGSDIVISGFTNNADAATDNVVVWRNGARAEVLLREGQPVTINGRQFFIGNFGPRFRGQAWITSDRKLVMLTAFFEAGNVCTNSYGSLVSGIVTIDLPPTGPVCNNPSNISGPGQNTTAIDAELTADDIIVFLNRFFAGNLLSDVSGPGQNTTAIDGELTADDIIVFLNRFFAGC
ncbi:MAG: GC-type dockerin domain-anchored protein [bacterium]